MKTNKLTHLLAIGLVLTFVATGCKHKDPKTTPIPDYNKPRVGDGGTGLPPSQPVNTGEKPSGSDFTKLPDFGGNLEDKFNFDRTALAANTVHFDFDSAAVRANEKAHLAAVADFMKSAPPGIALLVEGHCDERGTEENNRSLGEKRALALREALRALGADDQRITTRSYGKDRKIDPGNNEAAHAKNRRGEFVVLRPK